MLLKKPTGWEVHVPIVQEAKPYLRKVEELVKDGCVKICAVDLGISRHAVATIQDTEGRVYAAKFISAAKNHGSIRASKRGGKLGD
jgi:hypothetical protein